MYEELFHHGSEGEFLGFPVFEKVLIEIPQDRFETRADDGGHVEGVSDLGATSVGLSSNSHFSTIAVDGGNSGKCGGLFSSRVPSSGMAAKREVALK